MTTAADIHEGAPTSEGPEAAAPPTGLRSDEARRRLAENGPNDIQREKATSPLVILAAQFKGAMIWLLLGASVVSALLGEVADAVAIGAIVVLNALVGFFQEYRAEKAVQALRSMTAPRARVLRDGATTMIPATDVVVGDALVLEAGDIVPADARLRLAHALRINEAPLTGESAPVRKRIEPERNLEVWPRLAPSRSEVKNVALRQPRRGARPLVGRGPLQTNISLRAASMIATTAGCLIFLSTVKA